VEEAYFHQLIRRAHDPPKEKIISISSLTKIQTTKAKRRKEGRNRIHCVNSVYLEHHQFSVI
jgi:hypothetical protein